MNKIVLPALLAATIMVAGAFAFMPVEQASTVHTSDALEAASTIRISLDIPAVGSGTGAAQTGGVTFSLADGETGIFELKSVMLCDITGNGDFAWSTEISVFAAGTGNMNDSDGGKISDFIPNGEGTCFNALIWDDSDVDTTLTLMGDPNNDIILHFNNYSGDDDGATLVAYISGVSSAGDIDVTTDIVAGS